MKWWLELLCGATLAVPLACGDFPRDGSTKTKNLGFSQSSVRVFPTKKADAYAYVVLDGPPAVALLHGVKSESQKQTIQRVRARLSQIEAQHAALRSQVRAAGATIVAELSRLANVIEVFGPRAALSRVEHLPGVKRLDRVTLYSRRLAPEVKLIGASKVWQRTTPLVGDGIRIGIVDSGIDYTHADFGGVGTAAAFQNNNPTIIEPGTFPTQKVIGGYDFVGDAYDATNPSTASPMPDPDPIDCLQPGRGGTGGHGTHVAGIAAGQGVLNNGTTYTGPYNESLDPSAFKVFPGIAPRAKLYAFKIFGCTGSTAQLDAALERAVDPNQDGDLSDHLDVVNASLGTSYGPISQTEQQVVDNLEKAGTLLVVAAGNDGSTFYSASSPAVYPQALAVAASASSGYLVLTIDSPASIAGDIPAVEGYVTTPLSSVGTIQGGLVYTQPHDACSPLTNASALSGQIALIDRGTCTFTDKLNAAAAAGAKAVVVIDSEDEPAPISMGGGRRGTVSIPGVMIRKADGARIVTGLAAGVTATLDPNRPYTGVGDETIAGFSSRGPGTNGSLLKPEISGPGFNVSSARIGSGTEAVNESGTSMACPMITGAAALLREAHPELDPAEVKATLMNTAVGIQDLAGNFFPVSMQGAGRVDVNAAVGRSVSAAEQSDDGAVGMSFGALVTDQKTSQTRTLVVKNHGTDPVDYSLSAKPFDTLPGVNVSISPQTLSVPPGGNATATVTLSVDPDTLGAPGPDPETPATLDLGQNNLARQFLNEANGLIDLSDAASVQNLTLPYYAVVRSAADRHANALAGCAPAPGGPATIPLVGHSAAPVPVVSAFQLGAIDNSAPPSDPSLALLQIKAVGAATDAATKDFANASAYFGVALDADWATPALGPYGLVSILIDTNADDQPDYEITVEPGTKDGPYFDVLTATTYDLATNQATDSQRYINMEPPSKVQTYPFNNSVLVFGVFLHSLNLTAQDAKFRYAAATHGDSLFNPGEQTAWIDYDPMHPALDTAKDGMDGYPLYTGNSSVHVYVSPNASDGSLPKLLLLHHTNVFGKRVETVDLSGIGSLEGGNLSLTDQAPTETRPGQPFSLQLVVHNDSDNARTGVSVSLSPGDLSVRTLTPTQGSCTATRCDLGTLQPHADVAVAVTATTPSNAGGTVASLKAVASSAEGCETNFADNTITANVDVGAVPTPPTPTHSLPTYQPAGGCACRATGRQNSNGSVALALGAIAWIELERRRRSRRR